MEEFGIDRKTRKVIEETLTATKCRVKFMDELLEPFEIKTGVCYEDGLSPILFNIILKKITIKWKPQVKGIQIRVKKEDRIKIKCLALANDIAIFTDSRTEAIYEVEKLHEIAKKAGLQISYEKTKFLERRPQDNLPLITEYGKIAQVRHFKYLGETIQSSGFNKIANEQNSSAYKLTGAHYNKKWVSRDPKLRHYKTVILPEAIYAVEIMILRRHSKIKNLEKQERKILRKIYGLDNKNGIWTKRPN